LCGAWLLVSHSLTARAASPELTVKTDEGWFKTTYVITMNKEAAIQLRDATDRIDPKLIGGALTSATPHPGLKLAIAVVTGNAEAFKRTLNKEGTIGRKGITLTFTAYGGRALREAERFNMGRPNPLGDKVGGAVRDAAQISVNPWSWTVSPRE
jgi:hypothetical protein